MDNFYDVFRQLETELLDLINSISDKHTTEEQQAAVDKSLAGISQLSEKVGDAAGNLPSHDLQTYTRAINLLRSRFEEVRAASAPRKKFAFKKPNPQTATTGSSAKDSRTTSSSKVAEVASSFQKQGESRSQKSVAQPPPGFKLSSLKDVRYVLKASTLDDASIASLEEVHGSIVDLSMPGATTQFATLMVKNVQSSLLICGTIAGSTHVTGLKNCTIVITARQIRVHECQDVVIYLQCSSRPIIEDCKEIRFAPLPTTFAKDGPEGPLNMWNQVDDFKWLRPEPSPNWRTLTFDDDRAVDEEHWKKILNDHSTSIDLSERLRLAKLN